MNDQIKEFLELLGCPSEVDSFAVEISQSRFTGCLLYAQGAGIAAINDHAFGRCLISYNWYKSKTEYQITLNDRKVAGTHTAESICEFLKTGSFVGDMAYTESTEQLIEMFMPATASRKRFKRHTDVVVVLGGIENTVIAGSVFFEHHRTALEFQSAMTKSGLRTSMYSLSDPFINLQFNIVEEEKPSWATNS